MSLSDTTIINLYGVNQLWESKEIEIELENELIQKVTIHVEIKDLRLVLNVNQLLCDLNRVTAEIGSIKSLKVSLSDYCKGKSNLTRVFKRVKKRFEEGGQSDMQSTSL